MDRAANERDCRTWATQQEQYRSAFRKLFLRQWLLAPDYSIEAYATPAHELITTKYAPNRKTYNREISELLKPRGQVQLSYTPQAGAGYAFQIRIPYSSFPPINTLQLENLWLMVDVFNAALPGKKMGAFSSSSSIRSYGKPETFNQLRLQPQRNFHMGPCSSGLKGSDKYLHEHEGWFVPEHDQASDAESNSFVLVNQAEGYAYDPAGLSPIARTIHHFWRRIGQDEWDCGPELAYQKGQISKQYGKIVMEDGFDARHLPGGPLLIKDGPLIYYSEFGSGQCGACPRYGLRMFTLDQNLKLTQALALGGVVQGDGDAVDFALTPDWSQIIEYNEQLLDPSSDKPQTTWSATTYCLKGMSFEKCGEKKNVQPPNPPLLKELRELADQN